MCVFVYLSWFFVFVICIVFWDRLRLFLSTWCWICHCDCIFRQAESVFVYLSWLFSICHFYCSLGQVEIVFVTLVLDLSFWLYFETGEECFCLFVMIFVFVIFIVFWDRWRLFLSLWLWFFHFCGYFVSSQRPQKPQKSPNWSKDALSSLQIIKGNILGKWKTQKWYSRGGKGGSDTPSYLLVIFGKILDFLEISGTFW